MYGRGRPPLDGSPSSERNPPEPQTGVEEPMWQMSLGSRDSYPERPGEPDCLYYMRTGLCGYGARCRFNHPHQRSQVTGFGGAGGVEYPERVGQPVCQYFLKTGTCKFGATCKYHHPKHGGGSAPPVSLNYYGYPLRPGEKECSYYVKTGQCKFGVTCKFHHPQPSGISVPAPSYPTGQSPSVPSQYGGVASWQVAQPPLLPGSYMQGPYGPVLLSPGVVSVSGWSAYPPPGSAVVSPGAQNVALSPFRLTHQLSPSAAAYPGPYSQIPSPAGPSSSSQQEDNVLPDRPGEPECQFYMRTGDCKFGSTCKYHHPRDWVVPKTNCILSPMGFPLRQDLRMWRNIGGGFKRGELYYLDQQPLHSIGVALHTRNSRVLWNRRLGHPSLQILQKTVPSLDQASTLQCETCQLGKNHRSTFPRKSLVLVSLS